jgi:hypothetical protein
MPSKEKTVVGIIMLVSIFLYVILATAILVTSPSLGGILVVFLILLPLIVLGLLYTQAKYFK